MRSGRLVLAAVALALLAACATAPTAPAVVKQAVPEAPCAVAVPPRPTFPADALTGAEDVFRIGVVLWADRLARRAYELQLETALEGCTRPARMTD